MSCVANTIWRVKILRRMLLLAGLSLLPQSPVLAVQNVLLTWNPSQVAGVVGYKVYSGSASQNYSTVIDVGNATNVTISALPDGSTNYFSATTYDASTNESPHSAEVVFVAPATVVIDTNSSITNIVVDPTTNSTPTNSPSTNSPPTLNIVANLMVTTNPADASSVVLTWDASTDTGVAGYQVFYGTASGNYPNVTNLGLVNSLVITGLVAGVTNYFAVREYDTAGNESPMSVEINYALPLPAILPPTLNVVPDMSINMNTAGTTVTLTGIAAGSPTSNTVIKVTATSSNTNLIANPKITYVSPRSTAIMKFKPVPNASGMASITVSVNDGSNITTQTFNVTVINTIRLAALPKFVRQPKGMTVQPGRTAQLNVAVTGRGPFHYQWICNGTNLPGAIGQTLTVRNFSTNQVGVYSVFVWNSWGSTNSALAELSLPIPTNVVPVVTKTGNNNAVVPAVQTSSASVSTVPVISTPVRMNGQFSFQVTGLPGGKYIVLATEDLKNWSSVSTNTSPFTYTEPNVGSFTKRFYRALYQP